MKYLTLLMVFSLFLVSCTNYKEDLLTDPALCVTDNVSFSKDIVPILNNSCNTTGCHTAGGFAPGYLTNHAEVIAMLDGGKLINRVAETMDMPPSGPLSDCQIDKIKAWVDQGAKNN